MKKLFLFLLLAPLVSFGQGEAEAGEAIRQMIINKNLNKMEENVLLYELEQSVETAFAIAKSAKLLANAGEYDNRFGPILKQHKLLVIKYKGKYKNYAKAVKKGKEKQYR